MPECGTAVKHHQGLLVRSFDGSLYQGSQIQHSQAQPKINESASV